MNLADLRRTLGVVDSDAAAKGEPCGSGHLSSEQADGDEDGLYGTDSKARLRRLSMERMDLLKVCCSLDSSLAKGCVFSFVDFYILFIFSLFVRAFARIDSTHSWWQTNRLNLIFDLKVASDRIFFNSSLIFSQFIFLSTHSCIAKNPFHPQEWYLNLVFLISRLIFSFALEWLFFSDFRRLRRCRHFDQLTPDAKHLQAGRRLALHSNAAWSRELSALTVAPAKHVTSFVSQRCSGFFGACSLVACAP